MTNEEAIERLNHMKMFIGYDAESPIVKEMQQALDLAIKALEPQPKVGHWITTRTLMHDGEFYCDKCKCDSPNNEKWDYCPNCGAYMAESEDKE